MVNQRAYWLCKLSPIQESYLSRKTFPLRAVESVEKCSWECFRERTKSRPLIVRLAVDMKKLFATNCEGCGRPLISVHSTGEGKDRARWQVGGDVCSEVL